MEKAQRRPSLSGFEMRVLARELGALSGAYVSGIHSLGESQVFRLRRPGGEEADVVISPKYGAWITTKPAQTETNEFTSSLRRELLRTKLEGVTQVDMDRVLVFTFSGDLRLVLELMPPGNVIVTDRSGRIRLALRESRGPHRSIVPGGAYQPPPQNRSSPDEADETSIARAFAAEKTAGRALGRGLSVPRRYVDVILDGASLSQGDTTDVPPETIRRVASIVTGLVEALGSPSPSLVRTDEGLELMAVAPGSGRVVETAPTMSLLADRVLSPLLLDEESAPAGDENQQTRELEVTLTRLEEQVRGLTERAAALREAAEAVRETTSQEGADLALDATKLDPSTRSSLGGMSGAAAASSLFDRAKEAEAEVRRIREVEDSLRPRLRRALKAAPKTRVRLVTRPTRDWYEKFRWFFTTEGKLAVGGRDAQSNTILVKKHLTEGDVAYHADLFGSPFFVLKDGESQTSDEVRQVAQATAAFSSAWKTGLAAADAYWVRPEQVSATAPSGEFLARGSFVIRGKKNFATKNPVEVAVGVDSKGRAVAGPEESIMALCRAHVTLIPSREKTSDTAKKVLFELRKLYGDEAAALTLDDVARALPSGGGKIVRRRVNRQQEVPGETPGPAAETAPRRAS